MSDLSFEKKLEMMMKAFGGMQGNVNRVLNDARTENVHDSEVLKGTKQEALQADEQVLLLPYQFFKKGDIYQVNFITNSDFADTKEIAAIFGIKGLQGETQVCSKADYQRAKSLYKLYNTETEIYRPGISKDGVVVTYFNMLREIRRLENKLRDEINESGAKSKVTHAIKTQLGDTEKEMNDLLKAAGNRKRIEDFLASNRGPEATLLRSALVKDE